MTTAMKRIIIIQYNEYRAIYHISLLTFTHILHYTNRIQHNTLQYIVERIMA